jgi:hypothetical protein
VLFEGGLYITLKRRGIEWIEVSRAVDEANGGHRGCEMQ